MRTIRERVDYAVSMVGKRGLAGWCERFVRECFGFPARYSSALLAWGATKRRHGDINNAPAGVPIFWRLHPANPNYGLGHVALSVGGGYCISTSVGPGGSIGKVRTADLTRAWGMTPLGWTEDYHGRTVWPEASKGTKKKEDWLAMATKKDVEAAVDRVVRPIVAMHTTKLHQAFQRDLAALGEWLVDAVFHRIMGDVHHRGRGSDFRGTVVEVDRAVQEVKALVEGLVGAVGAIDGGESFDRDAFWRGFDERIAQALANTHKVVGELRVEPLALPAALTAGELEEGADA